MVYDALVCVVGPRSGAQVPGPLSHHCGSTRAWAVGVGFCTTRPEGRSKGRQTGTKDLITLHSHAGQGICSLETPAIDFISRNDDLHTIRPRLPSWRLCTVQVIAQAAGTTSKSDHLLLVAAYNMWVKTRETAGRQAGHTFCGSHFLSEQVRPAEHHNPECRFFAGGPRRFKTLRGAANTLMRELIAGPGALVSWTLMHLEQNRSGRQCGMMLPC